MGCTKSGFATEADAVKALMKARMRPAPHTWKVPTRAYLCPECSEWHLTSKPLRPRA